MSITSTSTSLITLINSDLESGSVFFAHCDGLLLKSTGTNPVLQALACAKLVLTLEESFSADTCTGDFFLQLNMVYHVLANVLKALGTSSVYFHAITDLLLAIQDCK